jgi:hypothetical protein
MSKGQDVANLIPKQTWPTLPYKMNKGRKERKKEKKKERKKERKRGKERARERHFDTL